MDADIFVSGEKKLRIQKYPDTCGRVLNQPTIFVVDSSFSTLSLVISGYCFAERGNEM